MNNQIEYKATQDGKGKWVQVDGYGLSVRILSNGKGYFWGLYEEGYRMDTGRESTERLAMDSVELALDNVRGFALICL